MFRNCKIINSSNTIVTTDGGAFPVNNVYIHGSNSIFINKESSIKIENCRDVYPFQVIDDEPTAQIQGYPTEQPSYEPSNVDQGIYQRHQEWYNVEQVMPWNSVSSVSSYNAIPRPIDSQEDVGDSFTYRVVTPNGYVYPEGEPYYYTV